MPDADSPSGTKLAVTGTESRRAEKRQAAVALMAAGLSYDDITRRLRVSKRSLVRWRGDPEFTAAVRRARSQLGEQLVGRIAAEAASTVDVLVTLRDGSASEATRLGACRVLLEKSLLVLDQAEIFERLEALEKAIASRTMAN
jgi:hypothetical protein